MICNNQTPQTQKDMDECVTAYYDGGKKLGALVFRAVALARGWPPGETANIGYGIRQILAKHGYLPIT